MTASSDEQCGTNLRRGLARDLGKWFAEIVRFKPALESLECVCGLDFKRQSVPNLGCR